MRSSIVISTLLAAAFVAVVAFKATGHLLHIGTWVAGFTEPKWWIYIGVCLTGSFAVCFYPRLRDIQLILCAPLIVTLLCKALSVLFLSWYMSLSIITYLYIILGMALTLGFGVHYFLSGGSAKLFAGLWLFTILGVAPVAHEFTEQMASKPLTSTSNSLRSSAPDAHCIRAV